MTERKPILNDRCLKRRRIPKLEPERCREIVALFDMTDGDYEYTAERCFVQRADVLAVVLKDTRRKGPSSEGGTGAKPFLVRGAA